MQIDLSSYEASKKVIVSWLSSRKNRDLMYNISMASVITSCPCIVVAYFAGEAFGWTEELDTYIKSLIKFYGYTSIVNKPEGLP